MFSPFFIIYLVKGNKLSITFVDIYYIHPRRIGCMYFRPNFSFQLHKNRCGNCLLKITVSFY